MRRLTIVSLGLLLSLNLFSVAMKNKKQQEIEKEVCTLKKSKQDNKFCQEVKDKENKGIKTSIIIPCHPRHLQHLYALLKMYTNQTVLPDEIIVSMKSEQLSIGIIEILKKEEWPFLVKLILSKNQLYAGENRNEGSKEATGDIFIYQDADDIPHPQRVEIIKYFFEKYEVDHLMHFWISPSGPLEFYSPNKVSFLYPRSLDEVWGLIKNDKTRISDKISLGVHFGNIAIARRVFDKIQWSGLPKGQDVQFDENAYQQFRCMIVRVPLVVYRLKLSSWAKS